MTTTPVFGFRTNIFAGEGSIISRSKVFLDFNGGFSGIIRFPFASNGSLLYEKASSGNRLRVSVKAPSASGSTCAARRVCGLGEKIHAGFHQHRGEVTKRRLAVYYATICARVHYPINVSASYGTTSTVITP